jgi:hypothetical protein
VAGHEAAGGSKDDDGDSLGQQQLRRFGWDGLGSDYGLLNCCIFLSLLLLISRNGELDLGREEHPAAASRLGGAGVLKGAR